MNIALVTGIVINISMILMFVLLAYGAYRLLVSAVAEGIRRARNR